MKANYHNNRYVRKARHEALCKSLLEAAEKRKREQLLYDLLIASAIGLIKNWGKAKPQNQQQ